MELKFVLEALLFNAQKPQSVSELRSVLAKAAAEEEAPEAVRALRSIGPEQIESVLEELLQENEANGRSFRLVCVAGSWQFVTLPEFAPWLRALVGVKNRPTRLSQPSLETLAIVAYRQPITRAEIEQIRGVAVDGVLATLLERNLIEQGGRAEVVGRPMTYNTTREFLEYFGLARLEDLPVADDLRRIPVQRPESLLTADAGLAKVPPESLKPEEPAGQTASGEEPGGTSAGESTDPPEPNPSGSKDS